MLRERIAWAMAQKLNAELTDPGATEVAENEREKHWNAQAGLTIVEWGNKLLRMIEFLGLLPQAEFPNAFAFLRCVR